MKGLLVTIEVLLGALAFLVIVAVVATFVRRRAIARGEPLVLCGLRDRVRWRFGFARYDTGVLEWYTLGGFSLRPRRRWERSRLDVGTAEPLPVADKATSLISSALRVPCRYEDQRFDLALSSVQYTALRSWLEASPPGEYYEVA